MKKTLLLTLLALSLTLGMAACSPMAKIEQSAVMDRLRLDSQTSIGQTFVAHYDGLSAIQVYFGPVERGDGLIRLELMAGPTDPQVLASGSISLADITNPAFYPIEFPPQKDSTQVYYYLRMQVEGSGSVNVGTAGGDTYINGALYQQDQPLDTQLAFNLAYEPARTLLGLVGEGLTWIWYLLAAAFLFVLPGWAILAWALPTWQEQDWAARAALSSGVSLALYPLLLLWTDLVGLHLGALYAWLPPILALTYILWRKRETIKTFSWRKIQLPKPTLTGLTLLIVLGLVFGVRFWVVRTLEAPMGSDSLHHTIAAQLILDHNGLMHSWEPYSPLATFTYHFGFHSAVAVFAWLTKIPILVSTFQVGQIINGLAILAVYPLANKIAGRGSHNKWPGVVGVLLAGLWFPMPMFYLNWGRYTQLAGQVVLPVTAILIWTLFESEGTRRKLVALTCVMLAGLGLTHYRVFIFIVFLFPALLIFNPTRRKASEILFTLLRVGLGSLLLFSPWLMRVLPGKLSRIAVSMMSTPAEAVSTTVTALKSFDIFSYLPGWAWIVCALVIGWGLWKRVRGVGIVSTWWITLLLGANPSWLNLPGEGLISHGAVITGAYLPVGALLGFGLWSWTDDLRNLLKKSFLPLVSLAIVFLGLSGVSQRIQDINPGAIYVTRPDLRAAEWMQLHLPQDAVILVNSTPIFSADWWYVGTDAGWWLPLVAQRQTTTQHMSYTIEKETMPGRIASDYALLQSATQSGVTTPEIVSDLVSRGITYLYIGQRGMDLLGTPVPALLENPNFSPVYHQDHVWIFTVAP